MRKATKFNRQMMWGMLAMAAVLLIVVFGIMYYALQNIDNKKSATDQSITQDTITVIIENE